MRFQLEARAQQCAGVIRYALQCRLICQPLLALCRGFLWLAGTQVLGWFGRCITLRVLCIAQCLLHTLLLRSIGLLLGLRILRLRWWR